MIEFAGDWTPPIVLSPEIKLKLRALEREANQPTRCFRTAATDKHRDDLLEKREASDIPAWLSHWMLL